MENPNHDADLQQFFSKVRKMVHLKENSKYKYIIENEEFRLVNKNQYNDQSSEVSVKRLPKLYIEDEIKKNSWININEELDFLFDMDSEKKWTNAIKRTGIDFTKFSSYSGNA